MCVLKRDPRHTTPSFFRYIFAIDPKEFGVEHDVLSAALGAQGIGCWVGYEAMHNCELFQPQKSKLAVPNAFPQYFDFNKMNLPEAPALVSMKRCDWMKRSSAQDRKAWMMP